MRSKILITLMFVANLIFAQGPFFNYKALITDNSGNALSNQSVNIRFTIYNDDPANSGTIEYQETHSLQTDANGIVVAEIGGGTSVSGNQIDDLNWASNLKYLKTEFDIGDGNGYQEIDTKQFYMMPYAYAARDAYNAQQVPYSGITNKPAWLADGDNDNQTLSVNGNQLTISNGNTVTLPTGAVAINGEAKSYKAMQVCQETEPAEVRCQSIQVHPLLTVGIKMPPMILAEISMI